MTEEEAQDWISGQFGNVAVDLLARFARQVQDENSHQNLIAPSTIDIIWNRHILDSAQLTLLAQSEGVWLDVGAGAGFPGLVVAALRTAPIICVEPRKLRADFMTRAAGALGLKNVSVRQVRVEQVSERAAVVSARAVAPVEKLLHAAAGCATTRTRWLLPRGRTGHAELASLRMRWKGTFHVEQSLTDPASTILVLDGPSLLNTERQ